MPGETVDYIKAVISADSSKLRHEVGRAIAALKKLNEMASGVTKIGGRGAAGSANAAVRERVNGAKAVAAEERKLILRQAKDNMVLDDQLAKGHAARAAREIKLDKEIADNKQKVAASAAKAAKVEFDAQAKAAKAGAVANRRAVEAAEADRLKQQVRAVKDANIAARAKERAAIAAMNREAAAQRVIWKHNAVQQRILENRMRREARADRRTGNMAVAAAGGVLGAGAGFAGREIIRLAADFERAQTSFRVMIGAQAGNTLINQVQKMAKETPLTTSAVLEATRTLLGFGFAADQVIPALKRIGDISSGTGRPLENLAVVYGQVRVAGKLMGQDLLQFINAGFNPLEEMAKKTGKSMSTLREEMHDGLITFEMVDDAFKSATASGGRFHGMMVAQSKTLAGEFERLKDTLEIAAINIGMNVVEPLKEALRVATKLSETVSTVAKGEGSAGQTAVAGATVGAVAVPAIALAVAAIKVSFDFLKKQVILGLEIIGETITSIWSNVLVLLTPTTATFGVLFGTLIAGTKIISDFNEEVEAGTGGFWKTLGNGIKEAAGYFKTFVMSDLVGIRKPLADLGEDLARVGSGLSAMAAGIGSVFDKLKEAHSGFITSMMRRYGIDLDESFSIDGDPRDTAGREARRRAEEQRRAVSGADWLPWEELGGSIDQLRSAIQAAIKWRALQPDSQFGSFESAMDAPSMSVAMDAYKRLMKSMEVEREKAGFEDAFATFMPTLPLMPSLSGILGIINSIDIPGKMEERLAGAALMGSVEANKIISQRDPVKDQTNEQLVQMNAVLKAIKDFGIPINNLGLAQ